MSTSPSIAHTLAARYISSARSCVPILASFHVLSDESSPSASRFATSAISLASL